MALPKPLKGVRIVDLTIAVAGPAATALLADMGAEVIKVENINARMPARARRRPNAEPSAYHRTPAGEIQRGKKAISLNLTKPEAKDAFLRLVAISDVVIDNFSPRVMPNFGFTYEKLKEVKSDIIVVSMPAFGSTGPYANRVSYGPGIDAVSGLQSLGGYFGDDEPIKPGHVLSDYNTAAFAAYSVMMALFHRSQTGEGQRIEVAMREAATFLIGEQVLDASVNGRVSPRMGNLDASLAPHNVYPCRDEDTWIAIAVSNDVEWSKLRRVINEPWTADARFDNFAGRLQGREEIDANLREWTRCFERYELMHRLQDAGVNAAAVLNAKDLAEDAHFQSRGLTRPIVVPEAGTIHVGRAGFLLSDVELDTGAGPSFAENNDEVLRGLLGMSAEDIKHMEDVKATSYTPVPLE